MGQMLVDELGLRLNRMIADAAKVPETGGGTAPPTSMAPLLTDEKPRPDERILEASRAVCACVGVGRM